MSPLPLEGKEPEENMFLDVKVIKAFMQEFSKTGIAKTDLNKLVDCVYPSYKMKFLGHITSVLSPKRRLPRAVTPTKAGLQVMYFKGLKKKYALG